MTVQDDRWYVTCTFQGVRFTTEWNLPKEKAESVVKALNALGHNASCGFMPERER